MSNGVLRDSLGQGIAQGFPRFVADLGDDPQEAHTGRKAVSERVHRGVQLSVVGYSRKWRGLMGRRCGCKVTG